MEDRDTGIGLYVVFAILFGIAAVLYVAVLARHIVISFHM